MTIHSNRSHATCFAFLMSADQRGRSDRADVGSPMPRVPATRERGLRAGCRFYRQHFLQVFTLSLVFYSAMIVFAVLSVVELGYFGLFPIAYLMVASIFWLQAPLVRLVDDVHGG